MSECLFYKEHSFLPFFLMLSISAAKCKCILPVATTCACCFKLYYFMWILYVLCINVQHKQFHMHVFFCFYTGVCVCGGYLTEVYMPSCMCVSVRAYVCLCRYVRVCVWVTVCSRGTVFFFQLTKHCLEESIISDSTLSSAFVLKNPDSLSPASASTWRCCQSLSSSVFCQRIYLYKV